jgi:hypothetical protein
MIDEVRDYIEQEYIGADKDIKEFDWRVKVERPIWLVDQLLPKGSLTILGSQSGVGKGWFIAELIVSCVYGKPFMGKFNIPKSLNVLVIDQDTPINAFNMNICCFANHIKTERKGKLIPMLHQDYTLGHKLNNAIRKVLDVARIDLVIIDTLSSVAATFENKEFDKIGNFRTAFPGLTFLIAHHVSEKQDLMTADDLMSCNAHKLNMYASNVNQRADMMLYLANPAHGLNCDNVYTRPYSKRYATPVKSFVWRLHQLPDREHMEEAYIEYLKEYTSQSGSNYSKDELMVIDCVKSGYKTVNKAYKALDGDLAINRIRDILKILEEKNVFIKHREFSGKKGSWSYVYDINKEKQR